MFSKTIKTIKVEDINKLKLNKYILSPPLIQPNKKYNIMKYMYI